jgi:hypothetical protein
VMLAELGRKLRRGDVSVCLSVIASEAKQSRNRSAEKFWIASSLRSSQ